MIIEVNLYVNVDKGHNDRWNINGTNVKKEAQKIIENEENLEKRKTSTRNLLIEEHERTEKLAVTSKALKEKISAEIQTEKTKGKKHHDQRKRAIRLATLKTKTL